MPVPNCFPSGVVKYKWRLGVDDVVFGVAVFVCVGVGDEIGTFDGVCG